MDHDIIMGLVVFKNWLSKKLEPELTYKEVPLELTAEEAKIFNTYHPNHCIHQCAACHGSTNHSKKLKLRKIHHIDKSGSLFHRKHVIYYQYATIAIPLCWRHCIVKGISKCIILLTIPAALITTFIYKVGIDEGDDWTGYLSFLLVWSILFWIALAILACIFNSLFGGYDNLWNYEPLKTLKKLGWEAGGLKD